MSWARALPDLYGTINATDAMTAALDGVSREVYAKGALFAMFNDTGVEYSDRYTNSAYLGKEEEILEYLQKYGDLEAYIWQKTLAASFGQPVKDLDIWPIGPAFREREDVKYVMNIAGVYRRVAYNLSPEVGWSAGFVFQYCESLLEIPGNSLRLIQNFLPHLAKTSELLHFVSDLRHRYKAVYGAIDRINVGVVVFDNLGRVVVSNAAADAIFSQADGLRLANGRLVARSPDTNDELQSKIISIASTSLGEGSSSEAIISVQRPSLLSGYTLALSPLKDGGAEIEKRFSGCLALIFDTAFPPEIDVAPLAVLARLTSAEAETAGLLLRGYTDRQIADMRNVTYETVRTQVKRVLEKSAVSNRSDLVRKAAMISPPTL